MLNSFNILFGIIVGSPIVVFEEMFHDKEELVLGTETIHRLNTIKLWMDSNVMLLVFY